MACGTSCLFSILKKMGWADPHWTQDPGWVWTGATPDALISTFRSSGFRSNHFLPKYMTDLNDLAKQGTSFILPIHNGLGKHYVVFEGAVVVGPGANDVEIYYMDPDGRYGPNQNHRKMSFAEYQRVQMGNVIWVSR